MQRELTYHIDYVLKIALQKCSNTYEAQDLCQDTLLAAVKYLSSGKEIENIQAWLVTVLNRKFYDSLRKKYNKPTVCYDLLPDILNNNEPCEDILHSVEEEELRRQIAYLSGIYRDVIVRHYLNGESIEYIAKALNIPQGTVKSRLSNGRTQIRKGFESMNNYTKQSYEPLVLYVGISGIQGLNGEPYSITDNNPIAQNLLFLAYDEPITEKTILLKL